MSCKKMCSPFRKSWICSCLLYMSYYSFTDTEAANLKEMRLLLIYGNCHHTVAVKLSETLQSRQSNMLYMQSWSLLAESMYFVFGDIAGGQVTVVPYKDIQFAKEASYSNYLVIFLLGVENRFIPGSLDENFKTVNKLSKALIYQFLIFVFVFIYFCFILFFVKLLTLQCSCLLLLRVV